MLPSHALHSAHAGVSVRRKQESLFCVTAHGNSSSGTAVWLFVSETFVDAVLKLVSNSQMWQICSLTLSCS